MSQHELPHDSYTARRLEHGTPEHLHITSRRTFIGPIPEGWLKSHRKHWYKQYFFLGTSKRPSFRAEQPALDGHHDEQPNAPAVLEPRPDDSTTAVGTSADLTTQDATNASTRSLLHSQHNRTPQPSPRILPQTAEDAPKPSIRPQTIEHGPKPSTKPRVTFNEASRLQLRARARRLASKTGLRSSTIKDGELLKVDKMLVRIDVTQQQLPDYDERISQGIETRMQDKWREFMVVCRKYSVDDADAVLQLYQTRVIAATEDQKVKKRAKAQILLSQRLAQVNLYSSLDKTLCVWTRGGSRTTIYYLRPLSGATSVEWFTFLRTMMGVKRSQTLQVNIPDLNISLRLDDPFRKAEVEQTLTKAAAGDEHALAVALSDESGAAGAIVARCMEMLKGSSEWNDVLKVWQAHGRIGLAWKRYDRLEWVHGAIEQKMYGTVAMVKTHDLQLLPKDHYSTDTRGTRDTKGLQEPPPVEGFLIRLTSQKGADRRMGKMMFKRLYFTSQNQYLLFLRPSRATPPPPPKMRMERNGAVPSTQKIAEQIPMIYDIDPYPLSESKISWLDENDLPYHEMLQQDQNAANEAGRQVNMLLASDGFIDFSDIKRVRAMRKGALAADDNVDEGEQVDFHQTVPDHPHEDGIAEEIEEDRIFELVLYNGLIIRLQAFSRATCAQWMKRVQELVNYWTKRAREDMNLYKSVREHNLTSLGIDERAEAIVGQFAYKWEVSQSFASSKMYNVCGLANCRSIHLSGLLFRKPRRHTTFTRCHVILSHGHILIYEDTLRSRTGGKITQIHHQRISSIDLRGCYLYSGLLTESDLLYQNRTFDSNMPGHHALPRIYLEDGWTSTDEDAMTTFVIWHSKSKSWFKSSKTIDDVKDARKEVERQNSGKDMKSQTKTQIERVSRLGTTGRSIVFKARSRAERDHWVLAIQNEIERLSSTITEDVRLQDMN
ncbi:hypothetical protein AMS68_006844 [Peltaster fructicola]|uniref:PH domain-containing protein n=1 Tax=Peltaster fructicola TaxID=286661 RepID=A0A6H0Y2U5_9PEZI|nr:hypothetical protein AMS68_006844 [Peltaster fructicola]